MQDIRTRLSNLILCAQPVTFERFQSFHRPSMQIVDKMRRSGLRERFSLLHARPLNSFMFFKKKNHASSPRIQTLYLRIFGRFFKIDLCYPSFLLANMKPFSIHKFHKIIKHMHCTENMWNIPYSNIMKEKKSTHIFTNEKEKIFISKWE